MVKAKDILTLQEAAEELNTRPGTIKQQLNRGTRFRHAFKKGPEGRGIWLIPRQEIAREKRRLGL